jgi:hypothetical protein
MLVKQKEFRRKRNIHLAVMALSIIHGPGDERGIFGGIGLPCIIMPLLLKVV